MSVARPDPDYLRFYDLEQYLFGEVTNRFRDEGFLSASDFFAIVSWKANRAKSKIREKLLDYKLGDVEATVRALTSDIAAQPSAREKMQVLWSSPNPRPPGWAFYLPIASAILTVLYPDEFTIYDVRVCSELCDHAQEDFGWLGRTSKFDRLWPGYQRFVTAVLDAAPAGLSLRDADRYLFGKSAFRDLQRFVATGTEPDAVSQGRSGA